MYVRWEQQVRRLDSSSCGLSIDGHGLLVVSVPVLDVPVVLMALKGRMFDLSVESIGVDGAGVDDEEVEMIAMLIVRLEDLL